MKGRKKLNIKNIVLFVHLWITSILLGVVGISIVKGDDVLGHSIFAAIILASAIAHIVHYNKEIKG